MPDPVFLITGASSGIGAETARQAAAAGHRLVLAARSERQARRARRGARRAERALAVTCDVTEWDDQEALVARALDAYGQIDVVFANAGFGAQRGFTESTPEQWRAMVLTNVYGAALTIRATLPALRESQGHLLLTGSVAGRRALPGSLYSATKWAVTAMGEAARQELNESGVPRHADRARHGRHAVLRQPPDRRARAGRRRARGPLRGRAARARGRQRDPAAADRSVGRRRWRGYSPSTTEITRPRRPRANSTVPGAGGEDRVVARRSRCPRRDGRPSRAGAR